MCECGSCNCNNIPAIIQINGTPGTNGLNGWSPLLAVITDGARRVHQIIGWTGGTGSPPSSTNQFIGPIGIVNTAALAADIRGATGATGATGDAAWIAVIANVVDSDRVVQQIVDWTGGGGTKPSIIDQFIGPIGIVNTAAAATDIRGAEGAPGQDLVLPNQTGNAGKILSTDGVDAEWIEVPEELPSLTGNANRMLRVFPDESGVEWYQAYSQYKHIPVQNSAYLSATVANDYYILTDGVSVLLTATLPNTSKTKRLCIIANTNMSSDNSNPADTLAHVIIRDATNNITYVDDEIDMAYRKNPVVQYMGLIVCTGQVIAVSFKRDSGASIPVFLGGSLSVFEVL